MSLVDGLIILLAGGRVFFELVMLAFVSSGSLECQIASGQRTVLRRKEYRDIAD